MMATRKPNRFRESFFDVPFLGIEAATYGLNRHAQFFGPLSHCFSFAVKFYQSISRAVVGLLVFIRPTAIIGAISLRVVYAIDGKFRSRLLAHVEQKEFKVFPAVTHTVANVKRLQRALWIAPLHHIRPGFVSGGAPRSIVGNSPLSITEAAFAAATTSNVLASKQLHARGFIVPAITFAHPDRAFFAFWRQAIKRYQTAKSLVRDVCCFHRDKYSVDTIISRGYL
jgi:hypothetical protein